MASNTDSSTSNPKSWTQPLFPGQPFTTPMQAVWLSKNQSYLPVQPQFVAPMSMPFLTDSSASGLTSVPIVSPQNPLAQSSQASMGLGQRPTISSASSSSLDKPSSSPPMTIKRDMSEPSSLEPTTTDISNLTQTLSIPGYTAITGKDFPQPGRPLSTSVLNLPTPSISGAPDFSNAFFTDKMPGTTVIKQDDSVRPTIPLPSQIPTAFPTPYYYPPPPSQILYTPQSVIPAQRHPFHAYPPFPPPSSLPIPGYESQPPIHVESATQSPPVPGFPAVSSLSLPQLDYNSLSLPMNLKTDVKNNEDTTMQQPNLLPPPVLHEEKGGNKSLRKRKDAATKKIKTRKLTDSKNPVKKFVCERCGTRFSRLSNLNVHKRKYEPDAPRCQYCQKPFSRAALRDEHERTHTKEKPYKCDICEKGFSQKHSKVDHMRTHTGEKPFECDICGRKFAVKNNLKTHKARHLASARK